MYSNIYTYVGTQLLQTDDDNKKHFKSFHRNVFSNGIIVPMVGAALEILYEKNIFKHFFSQCKFVDMMCPMKYHQGRFQKSHFLAFYVCFLVFFFLFCWEKCVFGWFSCCFHCCLATCVAFRPPLFYRHCRAPIIYICFI